MEGGGKKGRCPGIGQGRVANDDLRAFELSARFGSEERGGFGRLQKPFEAGIGKKGDLPRAGLGPERRCP
ncbi:MAG: hypothetical protein MZV70_45755 [Desulfobacterales bacterium]|nr:hypothetical protein [Desulfobacterales bacterium]